MNFNKQQWYTVIRTVAVFVSGILVAKGILPADFNPSQVVDALVAIVGGVGTIATLVQSLNSKTDKNQIAVVAAMPDVARIEIKRNATDGVAAAVNDSTPLFVKVVPEGVSNV